MYPTFPLTTKSTAAKLKNIRLDLFYIGFQHVGGSYQSERYQRRQQSTFCEALEKLTGSDLGWRAMTQIYERELRLETRN